MQWYIQLPVNIQQDVLKKVFKLVSSRPKSSSNFISTNLISLSDIKLIYRSYATLFFVFIVDSNESELGILDLIQIFVEALDRLFTNVCELDFVFRVEEISYLLAEIVSGGLVLETNIIEIMAANEAKRIKKEARF